MANIYTFNPFTATLDNTFSGTAVAVWGTIIGTLGNQTDLQNSINGLDLAAYAPLTRTGRSINITNVGNAADGYLTSTQYIALGGGQSHSALAGLDWTLAGHTGFQASISAVAPITLTGNTVSSVSVTAAADGHLTSSQYLLISMNALGSLTANPPITFTGGSSGVFNMSNCSNAIDGYLTSTQFINLITGSAGALSTSTAALHIAGGSTSIIGTGVSIDIASSHLGSSTAGIYIAGGSNSILGGGVSFDIATVSVTQAGLLTSSQYIYLSSGAGLSGVVPIIVGGGSTGITNVSNTVDGYLTSSQYITLQTTTAAVSFTRVEMSSAQIIAGIYPITHSKALANPCTVMVSVFNDLNHQVVPDEVIGSTNNCYLDMTSYGEIDGTWGVMYFA